MFDERGRHVAEQGRAMARGPLQLPAADAMTHDSLPSVRPATVSGIADQAVIKGTAQTHFVFPQKREFSFFVPGQLKPVLLLSQENSPMHGSK